MRVKVGRVVDLDARINLLSLSKFQKIIVPILYTIRDSSFYKRQKEVKLEKEQMARIQEEESLKEKIHLKAYGELIENKFFKSQGSDLNCKTVILTIKRDKEKILREIIHHNDFSGYHLEIIETNPDLLLSFPKLPILLSIKRKALWEVSN